MRKSSLFVGFSARLTFTAVMSVSSIAVAQVSEQSTEVKAFIDICGNSRGSLSEAIRAADAKSWVHVTAEEIGMPDLPATVRYVELRGGVAPDNHLRLMVMTVDNPDQSLITDTCTIVIYPSNQGQQIVDPASDVAQWVGFAGTVIPNEQVTETQFIFVDEAIRSSARDLDPESFQQALSGGRVHGVTVMYAPEKTTLNYAVVRSLTQH